MSSVEDKRASTLLSDPWPQPLIHPGSHPSQHTTPAKQLVSVPNLLHRIQSTQVLFCAVLSILCARELTTSQYCLLSQLWVLLMAESVLSGSLALGTTDVQVPGNAFSARKPVWQRVSFPKPRQCPCPPVALSGWETWILQHPLGPSRTAWLASVAFLLISNWQ